MAPAPVPALPHLLLVGWLGGGRVEIIPDGGQHPDGMQGQEAQHEQLEVHWQAHGPLGYDGVDVVDDHGLQGTGKGQTDPEGRGVRDGRRHV